METCWATLLTPGDLKNPACSPKQSHAEHSGVEVDLISRQSGLDPHCRTVTVIIQEESGKYQKQKIIVIKLLKPASKQSYST